MFFWVPYSGQSSNGEHCGHLMLPVSGCSVHWTFQSMGAVFSHRCNDNDWFTIQWSVQNSCRINYSLWQRLIKLTSFSGRVS